MVKERRAKFVYRAGRLHAIELGCPIIPKIWEERRGDFKEEFVQMIDDLCTGKRKPKDFAKEHDTWAKRYLDNGWKYGKVYDPDNKVHPDLVPYNELDPKEKVKDEVFLRLVNIAKDCIW